MSEPNCKPIIEAILFATHDPVSAQKLSSLIKGSDTRAIRKSINDLKQEYDASGRGFTLVEVAGGYQLLSRKEFSDYIRELHRSYAEAKLSQAALETLAIIAYKQPVLRAEIEAIRGVQAGPLLRSLTDRDLAKIVGRADTLGRPALYGTTRRFLERFMLKSLKDLPQAETVESGEKDAALAVPSENLATSSPGEGGAEDTPECPERNPEEAAQPVGSHAADVQAQADQEG